MTFPFENDTTVVKQQIADLSREYDKHVADVEKNLNRIRKEKDSQIQAMHSLINADPSVVASKLQSPQHSTPAPASPGAQHLLNSINRLAPSGIYAGGNAQAHGTMPEPPCYPSGEGPTANHNLREGPRHRFDHAPPLVNINNTNPNTTGNNIPPVITNSNTTRSSTHETSHRPDRTSDSLPKLQKYDGSGQWKSFYIQFKMYANIKGWSEQEKLNNLCLCLRDKALDFFVCQPDHIQQNYLRIVEKMEKRFGKKDIAETLRVQFNRMRQKIDEPLEEWAERVQKVAQEAYMDLPDDFITNEIVRKFCQGISDKETAQYVSDRRPNTIERALQLVKAHVENNRAIYGSKINKKQVRQISSPDRINSFSTDHSDSDSDGESPSVRAVTRQTFVDLDKQVKKLEETFTKKFDQLWTYLQSKDKTHTRPPMSPQRQQPPFMKSPPSSPRRGNCYTCGEAGHFSFECPKRGILKNNSSSPNNKKPDTSSSPAKKEVSFDRLNARRSDT